MNFEYVRVHRQLDKQAQTYTRMDEQTDGCASAETAFPVV